MDHNAVLDGLHESLIILDEERRILFMNKPATGLFGDGFIGKNFIRLIRHPDVIGLISTAQKSGDGQTLRVRLNHPFQSTFEFKVSLLANKNGDGPSIAIALRDLTDLINAEQMRSDFVANVSHELRSPLTALSGFIETIKGPAKDDKEARERFLGLMEGEAARMVRLISDLLSLSKVETNRNDRPIEPVNLAEVTRRVVTTLSDRAKAEGKLINLEIDPNLKPVIGSEDELTQVLINLIENAIKYGHPQSTVFVRLKNSSEIAGFANEVLTLEVEDQGEGIAREHIPRLTERFYRIDTHRSRDKGGTGLGLAIVKHIVSQHRGRLQISSIVGKGSVFRAHLPYSK
ncbi:MAG: ATP-binding protein [Salaquimonas sp.]